MGFATDHLFVAMIPVMGTTIRTTKQILVTYYVIALHLMAIHLVIDKMFERYRIEPNQHAEVVEQPINATQAPSMPPAEQPTQMPEPSAAGLIVPVAGVRPDQLTDSFADTRGGGRVHDAIDIMAPAGTPVIATADGKLIKFFDSDAGGVTIYQLSADQRYVYYYAHLQRRADDVREGDQVKQGRTIGYVGDTGNAGTGNNHLHFSVMAVADPNRFREGTYVNPYPLFRN